MVSRRYPPQPAALQHTANITEMIQHEEKRMHSHKLPQPVLDGGEGKITDTKTNLHNSATVDLDETPGPLQLSNSGLPASK